MKPTIEVKLISSKGYGTYPSNIKHVAYECQLCGSQHIYHIQSDFEEVKARCHKARRTIYGGGYFLKIIQGTTISSAFKRGKIIRDQNVKRYVEVFNSVVRQNKTLRHEANRTGLSPTAIALQCHRVARRYHPEFTGSRTITNLRRSLDLLKNVPL